MTIEAVINLDTLRCLKEHDSGGSEPYVWAALFWVEQEGDQLHFGSDTLSASAGGLAVVKGSMKRGQSAPMPSAQRRFVHRFDDGTLGAVGIITVLLEHDELEAAEVRKGYDAFVRELDAVVGGFIEKNDHEPMEDELEELVDKIKSRVTRTIKGSLTLAEKIGSLFGTHDPDQVIGFATFRKLIVPGVDESFTLLLEKIDLVPHVIGQPSGGNPVFGPPIEVVTRFELDGRIVVRNLAPPVVVRPKPRLPIPPIPRSKSGKHA